MGEPTATKTSECEEVGGRETTPPPLQPSRPQRQRARRRGRRRGKAGGWETGSSAPARGPRRPPPREQLSAGSLGPPAPVSGAALAPRDDQRETRGEYALQILRAHRFPPCASLWRKERERDGSGRRCSAPRYALEGGRAGATGGTAGCEFCSPFRPLGTGTRRPPALPATRLGPMVQREHFHGGLCCRLFRTPRAPTLRVPGGPLPAPREGAAGRGRGVGSRVREGRGPGCAGAISPCLCC